MRLRILYLATCIMLKTTLAMEKIGEWYTDGSGNDISGKGNAMMVMGGVKFVKDPWTGTDVATHDGSTQACSYLPINAGNTGFQMAQTTTLGIWVRAKSSATKQQAVFSWSSGAASIVLYIQKRDATGKTDLALYTYGASGAGDLKKTFPDVGDQWNHLNFVFTPSAAVNIWQNGYRVGKNIPFAVSFVPTVFSLGCAKQDGRNIDFPMQPGSFIYKSTFHVGAYPCSGQGNFYYNGKCHWFTPESAFDKGACSPDGKLVSIHTYWDDLLYSRSSPNADCWVGISAPGPRPNTQPSSSNWFWEDGTPMDLKLLWCGDAKHRQADWYNSKDGCEAHVQPNEVSTTCARYSPTLGPGLADLACTNSFKHLCYEWQMITEAPDTTAPSTPFPDTKPPSTPVPVTQAPPTPLPDTSAPATRSPSTSAPPTKVPATLPPDTDAPSTPFPDTRAPWTPFPDTNAPSTLPPSTNPPATPFPDTAAPATNPPATNPPATPIPRTVAPLTAAPATAFPDTIVPPTSHPATGGPTVVPSSAPATSSPTSQPMTAVPTSAPTAPPTGSPPTVIPATSSPLTGSPLTSQPMTAVPTSTPIAPPTGAPPVPVTSQPVAAGTSSPNAPPKEMVTPPPLTPVPGQVIPEAEKNAAKGVTSGATAVNPSGAKLAAVIGMDCEVEDIDLGGGEPLDWEFHPLGFGIGDHKQKYFLGAVVSNLGIVVVFLILNYVIAWVQVAWLSVPWETAIFYVRAPGLVYIPMIWLLMGTSIAASNLAFFPSRAPAWVAIIGVLALALCVSLPVAMWFLLLRKSKFQATTVLDPKINWDAAAMVKAYNSDSDAALLADIAMSTVYTGWKRTAYIIVFGSEVWVRKDGAPDYFVEQYGLFFEQYRYNYHWFSLVEMTQILALALTSVWKPHNHDTCMFRNASITIVLFFYFLAIVTLRPYNSTLDMVTGTAMSGLMFVAVLLMAIAIGVGGNEVMMKWAAYLLFLTALLMIFKGVYDLILYCLDVKIGRRWDAVRAARAGNAGEVREEEKPRVIELDEVQPHSSVVSVGTDEEPGLSREPQSFVGSFGEASQVDMTPLLSFLSKPTLEDSDKWNDSSSTRRSRRPTVVYSI